MQINVIYHIYKRLLHKILPNKKSQYMFHKKKEIQFIQYDLLREDVYKYNSNTIKVYTENYVDMQDKITIENHVYNINAA